MCRLGGSWLFWYPRGDDPASRDSVVVRADKSCFITLGAIGKVYHKDRPDLGCPASDERWLGSTVGGRYQLFDCGLVVWPGVPDIAYVSRAREQYRPGKRQECVVAVVDVRGFTKWSKHHPARVQGLVSRLEVAFQKTFSQEWPEGIFVKGTGDGMLIVCPCEKDRSERTLQFVIACLKLMRTLRGLPRGLKLGCGIDIGILNQVFLFGHPDYLGDASNAAAKLQALGRDTMILSSRVVSRLRAAGPGGVELSRRATRVPKRRAFRIRPYEGP